MNWWALGASVAVTIFFCVLIARAQKTPDRKDENDERWL
jgi:hypothetical protein